jgi:hypothetical protein
LVFHRVGNKYLWVKHHPLARIFNICFHHKEQSYSALVTVRDGESDTLKVSTADDQIQIILPNGSLKFSIPELLSRLFSSRGDDQEEHLIQITPSISLRLLNMSW